MARVAGSDAEPPAISMARSTSLREIDCSGWNSFHVRVDAGAEMISVGNVRTNEGMAVDRPPHRNRRNTFRHYPDETS
jgi:hypothetical protein